MSCGRIALYALAFGALAVSAVAASAQVMVPIDPAVKAAPPGQAVKTGKERLGDKASDEQRVDNCKVPPELRGPKPRPDACSEKASATPMY